MNRLNTGEEESSEHESPPQKPDNCEKPPRKRKRKRKHLDEQGTRKRPYLTEDDSSDTESTKDTVAVPRKVMKKEESTLHHSTLLANAYKQKPRKRLQQPTSQLTPQPATQKAPRPRPRRRMPYEARSIRVNKNAGETLLQRAAYLGCETVVRYCVKNNVCDIHHHDDSGYCALHEACSSGWLNIARFLLQNGAHVNCIAESGIGPIHDAVLNDHIGIVRLLLSYGADPMLPCSGKTIFQMPISQEMATFLANYFN